MSSKSTLDDLLSYFDRCDRNSEERLPRLSCLTAADEADDTFLTAICDNTVNEFEQTFVANDESSNVDNGPETEEPKHGTKDYIHGTKDNSASPSRLITPQQINPVQNCKALIDPPCVSTYNLFDSAIPGTSTNQYNAEFEKENFPAKRQTITRSSSLSSLSSCSSYLSGSTYTVQEAIKITGIFDPEFGIRVSRPKMSLDEVNMFCTGMQKIKLSMVNVKNQPVSDWCTMGVIVEKSELRKSTSSNEYIVWKLSDINGLQRRLLKALLFGDCLDRFKNLPTGTVVVICNAQWFESGASEAAIKLVKVGQVIELGNSPDFGYCKAKKTDGKFCSNFVISNQSEYCQFHVQQKAIQLSRQGSSEPEQPVGLKFVRPHLDEVKYFKPTNLSSQRNAQMIKGKNPPSITRPKLIASRHNPQLSALPPKPSTNEKSAHSMRNFISHIPRKPNIRVFPPAPIFNELRVTPTPSNLAGQSGMGIALKRPGPIMIGKNTYQENATINSREPPRKKRNIDIDI